MNKLIGAVLVISSCSMLGFYFSSELKTRIDNLKELKKLLILLRGDIEFANTPLPEAVQTLSKRHDGTYKEFLENISKQLLDLKGESFASIWKKGVKEYLMHTSLVKEDYALLNQLGDSIGYLDKTMQINTLDLYLEQIDRTISELSESVKERTHLYNSLGIMGGIFITIILL
ncbi:MAG: sporulation protein [Clostridiales bacterium]|nr:sporulation protein [Clostridiales bacterium]